MGAILLKKKNKNQGEDKRTCILKKHPLRETKHVPNNLTANELGHGSSTLSDDTYEASDASTSG